MTTGIKETASPLILILCFAIIALAGFRPASLYRGPILLYSLTLFGYFLIGSMMRIYYEPTLVFDRGLSLIFRNAATSVLVIFSYLQYFHQRLFLDGALDRVIKLFGYPLIATCIVLILQLALGVTSFKLISDQTGSRTLGVFGNPNTAATAANMALVVCIDLFFRYPRYWYFNLILIGLAVVACIIPFSRTGIIVMIATLLAAIGYYLFRPRVNGKKRNWQRLLFIFLPLLMSAYFLLNYDYILENYLDYAQRSRVRALELVLTKGEINAKTTSDRSEVFVVAWEMIKERPLLGHGIGMFNDIPGTIGVHNTYLLTWGNAGILPLAGILVMILFVLPWQIFRKSYVGFLLTGFTIVTALTFMTSHNSYDDKVLILMFLFPMALATFTRPLKQDNQF